MDTHPARPSSHDNSRLCLWLIPLLAVLAFLPALRNEPIYDDVPLVRRAQVPDTLRGWAQVLVEPWWGSGSIQRAWRPVTKLSILAQKALHPQTWWPFYAVNVALHAACAWLVLRLARRLGWRPLAAGLAAALFALHPVHAEAIHQVVGRGELLAAIFMLIGLDQVLARGWDARGQGWVQALCLFAALGAKEHAITYPAVVALLWFAAPPSGRRSLRRAGPVALGLIAAALLFLFLRARITGGLLTAHDEANWHENPIFTWPFLQRLPAALGIFGFAASRMVCIYGLAPDYSAISLPLFAGWRWGYVWLGLALLAVMLTYAWRNFRAGRRGWALALAALGTYTITSNLFFPVGVALAERLWYWPSVAVCLAAGFALERLLARIGQARTRGLVLALLAVLLLGADGSYAGAWRNVEGLTEWTLRRFPNSVRGLDNASLLAYTARDHERGYALARQALAVHRDTAMSWEWLGMHAAHLPGRAAEAEAAYRKSLELDPLRAHVHRNLGLLYESQGRTAEARREYEQYLAADPFEDAPAIAARLQRLGGPSK